MSPEVTTPSRGEWRLSCCLSSSTNVLQDHDPFSQGSWVAELPHLLGKLRVEFSVWILRKGPLSLWETDGPVRKRLPTLSLLSVPPAFLLTQVWSPLVPLDQHMVQ